MSTLFDDDKFDLDDNELWRARMDGPDADRMQLRELLAAHPEYDGWVTGPLNDAQIREHVAALRGIDRRAKRYAPESARGSAQRENKKEEVVVAPAVAKQKSSQEERWLKATWKPDSAYCADSVKIVGESKGLEAGSQADGTLQWSGSGALENLKGKAQNKFALPWLVKDVVFEGAAMPEKYDVNAHLSAGGLTSTTDTPLRVYRVPDQAEKAVTLGRRSGRYSWDAAFRVSLAKDRIDIKQTLQIKKAWLGKWVAFDLADDGIDGWGFIKKVGPVWKYWDFNAASANKWRNLPRPIGDYEVNQIVFVKSGSDFVSRDDPNMKWPEFFSDPTNYDQKKADWLKNIHDVWDDKFDIRHKQCKSGSKKCCAWRLRVSVNWSDAAGDKTVYAVWAQDWERSDAQDWYLTENRQGLAAHECGHLLGAYDEYTGGAVDPATNKIEDDSVMGQNLTKGKDRHFDGLRDQVKKIVNAAISRAWDFEVKAA